MIVHTDRPSPALLKAARALLGWGLDDLCARTGLCKAVVHGFESGRVASTAETREKIMGAFAAAGIEFADAGPLVSVRVDPERARQYERNFRRRVARQEAA